jgi:hypothetical protein
MSIMESIDTWHPSPPGFGCKRPGSCPDMLYLKRLFAIEALKGKAGNTKSRRDLVRKEVVLMVI